MYFSLAIGRFSGKNNEPETLGCLTLYFFLEAVTRTHPSWSGLKPQLPEESFTAPQTISLPPSLCSSGDLKATSLAHSAHASQSASPALQSSSTRRRALVLQPST